MKKFLMITLSMLAVTFFMFTPQGYVTDLESSSSAPAAGKVEGNEGYPNKLPAPYHALKTLKSLKDAGFEAQACIREQGEDTEILIVHRKGGDKILTRPKDDTNDLQKWAMEAAFVINALHDVRINANDDWAAVRVLVVLPMRVYSANLDALLHCKGRLKNQDYRGCLARAYLANPVRDDLDPWPDCIEETEISSIEERQFAIRDSHFEAEYKGDCKTEANIISVEGDTFSVGGQVSIRYGEFVVWCYGAKHTWIGTLTYAGYTFASDENTPLQFMVSEDQGYVYVDGKGTVTFPDGSVVTLP